MKKLEFIKESMDDQGITARESYFLERWYTTFCNFFKCLIWDLFWFTQNIRKGNPMTLHLGVIFLSY